MNAYTIITFVEVINFIDENKDDIIQIITPQIQSFLQREVIFQGVFLQTYNDVFNSYIKKQVRDVILSHFPLTIEDALCIIEEYDLTYFLDKEKYR